MKKLAPVLLAMLALSFSSWACSLFAPKASLENVRIAFDADGEQTTTTFSPTDAFYAVADLKNAPMGTVVKAQWLVVSAEGFDAPPEIPEQTREVTEEHYTGTVYFELLNDLNWPAGQYRVDIYLNDTLEQSLEFNVE